MPAKRRKRIGQRRQIKQKPPRRRRRWWVASTLLALLALLFLLPYIAHLNATIKARFEGKRWAVPARVYARALELYAGKHLVRAQFQQELDLLGYRQHTPVERPGDYAPLAGGVVVYSRAFQFWDGHEPQRLFKATMRQGVITRLTDVRTSQAIALLRLDPYQYASFTTSQHEDRVLVARDDIPGFLVQALIAVEDRDFYRHPGVNLRGLIRAALSNVKAGKIVQGGSTLTQQLVKNYFLTDERSLKRKFKEAIMAVLLDWHYPKDEILAAYCNEIYLGQDGDRAIHGFGLAAIFYFGRRLQDLGHAEIALLVGMLKGPSYYDPHKHPERALARRNQVLDTLHRLKILSAAELKAAKKRDLAIIPPQPVRGLSRFPAFASLVQRQLQQDYREADLRSEGLQIFTTLDPLVQLSVERGVKRQLAAIEKRRGFAPGTLEAAVVVSHTNSGEVLALLGGRNSRVDGFNRALDAQRQVGSIIKPAIYLTALATRHYHLASPLLDAPITVDNGGGKQWTPNNFNDKFRGQIPLYQALRDSANAATVRLGLALGIDKVVTTLHKLGITRPINPFPSVLLGALELTPFEVAQMYQTLADNGFKTRLRAIRAVLDADGKPLQRYSLEMSQSVAPEPVYLLNTTLQRVVRAGTATALQQYLDPEVAVAGKTGTTNDFRDSWFAGFTGDRVAVVWVGRDDNRSAQLTGSRGALPVWGTIMSEFDLEPLLLTAPPGLETLRIDTKSGLLATHRCADTVELPFLSANKPEAFAPCSDKRRVKPAKEPLNWLQKLFGGG